MCEFCPRPGTGETCAVCGETQAEYAASVVADCCLVIVDEGTPTSPQCEADASAVGAA